MSDEVMRETVRGVTVKIYPLRKANATYYRVADYSTGIRRFISCPDEVEARKEARRIAGLISKGDALGATMTGAERQEYVQASKYLEGTGATLPEAAREYANALKLLGKVPLSVAIHAYKKAHADVVPKTVPEVLAELLKIKSENKMKPISESYLKDLNRLNKFANSFQCAIGDVTSIQIEDFIAQVSEEGRTQYNYGRLLRTLFNFAEKRNYLPKDQNPFEKIELEFLDDSEIEIFTPGEMRQILGAARPEMMPFLAIGAFAGLRHMEIRRLDWSEIGAEYITVQKGKAKTRSRRLVPVRPNLAQWLAPYRKNSGPVIEFEHVSKQLGWLVDDINSELNEQAEKKNAPAPAQFRWKHNALRHSFITYRMAVTKDENLTACEAGNSPKMIHGNYRALATDSSAKEWFEIMPPLEAAVGKIVVMPTVTAASELVAAAQ